MASYSVVDMLIAMHYSRFISSGLKLGALLGSASAMFVASVSADSQFDQLQQEDTLSDSQLENFQAQGRWLGPGWWANRLQDWQRTGNQGEGIRCAPNKPFLAWRAAHDMLRPLDLSQGQLDVSVKVTLASSEQSKPLSPQSLTGFLVGAGHTLDNPMARAMVFDFKRGKNATTPYPAVPGSGIAAGVSGNGQLRIIDLDTGKVRAEGSIKLTDNTPITLTSQQKGASIELTLRSNTPNSQSQISATFPTSRFKGGIALLSHAGPRSKKHGSLISTFTDYTPKSGFKQTNSAAIGPVVAAQYSVHQGVLKLSAQCMPQTKGSKATLSFFRDGQWQQAATAPVHDIDQLALFRVEQWDSSQAVPYRVNLPLAGSDQPASYTGTIAAEPKNGKVRLAALGCIIHRPWGAVKDWSQILYFPHHDLQKRVAAQKPDVVFFYGDQMYEGTPSPVDRQNYFEDYLYKWLFHCQAFKEVLRNVPSITIPDDHDVYQGNYWGEGGRVAPEKNWNNGGYLHPGEFIAQVHRTQTSHLPDAAEPDCLKQNIPAYHCDWNWGGVSFAILGDRAFKSGPAGHGLPKSGTNRPDHYNNPEFDTADLDLPGLQLLGEPQERFLAQWAADWSHGAQLKAVLSQSPFGNFATHHAGSYLIADLDSNGWPQSGRKRALTLLRSARAVHIAGDQHLSTMVQHGIENHGDAIFGFTAPAVANAYARAYYPALTDSNYYKATPPTPDQYLGKRLDGFKNKVTFLAVANPDTRPEGPYHTKQQPQLNHQVPGFGLVDFDTRAKTITFQSLPRSEVVASRLKGGNYPGWPVQVTAQQNDGRKPTGELAQVTVDGKEAPVVRVYGTDGTLQWAQRMTGTSFSIPAYAQGEHRVEIGDGEGKWHEFTAKPQDKAPKMKVNLP